MLLSQLCNESCSFGFHSKVLYLAKLHGRSGFPMASSLVGRPRIGGLHDRSASRSAASTMHLSRFLFQTSKVSCLALLFESWDRIRWNLGDYTWHILLVDSESYFAILVKLWIWWNHPSLVSIISWIFIHFWCTLVF